MKLHHAAALAFVAWYLMLPPPNLYGQRLAFEPLSDWKLIDEFDSESACRQMRARLIERMPGTEIDTARCVPSDDPNLLPEHEPGVPEDLGGG
jgi:hypothetical protein